MSEEGLYLFVYGTLKRGQRNHSLIAESPFIGEAVTEPLYRLYDLGPYPCLAEDADNGRPVRGEVFLVDARTLRRLDRLEDVPHLYERKTVRLHDFGPPVATYLYRQPVADLPDAGDTWTPALSL
jgi:gamma-glutamylcyclotransferase (GGCT)/AIG2-like uncharacterized protein YtfP